MLLLPQLSLSLLALCNRRKLISSASAIAIANGFVGSAPAGAEDISSELYLARPIGSSVDGKRDVTTRPSAPIEYLLPAARVGVYIYTCLSLAQDLLTSDRNEDILKTKLYRLENLLIHPPPFIKSNDPIVTRGDPYNLPPIVGEFAMASQKQKERQQNSIDAGFVPQFFEVGQLIGERRAWDRLTKSERMREEQSEIRRALNIYTTNINFSTSRYTFAGTDEEKRRMIREDRLPTAVDVIRSDLDARDLYRNELQTALDDANAEFLYQKRVCGDDILKFDANELVVLLETARKAVDSWFSFVPDQDVSIALELVKKE